MTHDAIIIGAGLSGLAAAHVLEQAGIDYLLVEASDRPGGRMKTDLLDGFQLDRGFHVFLTAYPELSRFVDCKALELFPFYKGALVWDGQTFGKLADPFRHPVDALKAMPGGLGTWKDKFLVAKLRQSLRRQEDPGAFGEDIPTLQYLQAYGFSEAMIDGFFKPFFGGIFLEDGLQTPSRVFRFLFRVFARGQATLPARGIESVPAQMAKGLPAWRIRLNTRVERISFPSISLSTGETCAARTLILATDARDAETLIPGLPVPSAFNQTTCLYFACDEPPVDTPILLLNGAPGKCVNHLAVPSLVAPGYAPRGRHLVSVSTLSAEDPATLLPRAMAELKAMFGTRVDTWQFLRHYAIPRALPGFTTTGWAMEPHAVRVAEGVYRCGDYMASPSVNGALASGRQAAEAVLERLKVPAAS